MSIVQPESEGVLKNTYREQDLINEGRSVNSVPEHMIQKEGDRMNLKTQSQKLPTEEINPLNQPIEIKRKDHGTKKLEDKSSSNSDFINEVHVSGDENNIQHPSYPHHHHRGKPHVQENIYVFHLTKDGKKEGEQELDKDIINNQKTDNILTGTIYPNQTISNMDGRNITPGVKRGAISQFEVVGRVNPSTGIETEPSYDPNAGIISGIQQDVDFEQDQQRRFVKRYVSPAIERLINESRVSAPKQFTEFREQNVLTTGSLVQSDSQLQSQMIPAGEAFNQLPNSTNINLGNVQGDIIPTTNVSGSAVQPSRTQLSNETGIQGSTVQQHLPASSGPYLRILGGVVETVQQPQVSERNFINDTNLEQVKSDVPEDRIISQSMANPTRTIQSVQEEVPTQRITTPTAQSGIQRIIQPTISAEPKQFQNAPILQANSQLPVTSTVMEPQQIQKAPFQQVNSQLPVTERLGQSNPVLHDRMVSSQQPMVSTQQPMVTYQQPMVTAQQPNEMIPPIRQQRTIQAQTTEPLTLSQQPRSSTQTAIENPIGETIDSSIRMKPRIDTRSQALENNYYQDRGLKKPIVRELTEEQLAQSYLPRTRTMEIPFRRAETTTSPVIESVRPGLTRTPRNQDMLIENQYERRATAPLYQSQVSQMTEYPVEERFFTITRSIKPIPLHSFDKSMLNVQRNGYPRPLDESEVIGMPPAQMVGVPGCKICGGYGFIKFKKNKDKKLSCLSCFNDTGYCPRCDNSGIILNDPKQKCNCGNRK
jgi:hypothetical protein